MHNGIVLIVDDKHEMRTLVSKQLRMGGITCEAAATAREALERVSRADVSLVLIDVALAHPREGLELADKVRGLDPALPIIFFTGNVESVDEYPHVPLVTKPHTARSLVSAVQWELNKYCHSVLIRETHTMIKAHIEDCAISHKRSLADMFMQDVKSPAARVLLTVVGTMLMLVATIGIVMLKGAVK